MCQQDTLLQPQEASGSLRVTFFLFQCQQHGLGPPTPLSAAALLPDPHTIYLGSSHSLQKLTTSLVSGAQIRPCLCCRDCCKWHLCLISFHPQSLLRTILMLSSASCLFLILYAVVYLFSHFPFKVCRMDVLCIWHHSPCLFSEMALCVCWFSFPPDSPIFYGVSDAACSLPSAYFLLTH